MNNGEIMGAKQRIHTAKYMLNRKQRNRSVWCGKIMQRKQREATAARNIWIGKE
jgi:hypothetical protein